MCALITDDSQDLRRFVCKYILTWYGVKVNPADVRVQTHTQNNETQVECVIDVSQSEKVRP